MRNLWAAAAFAFGIYLTVWDAVIGVLRAKERDEDDDE